MKKKKLAGLISSLACISLIGVGFASWVITGNDSKEANGTINAEAIYDYSVEITKLQMTDAKIHFGAPATMNNNKWLINSNGTAEDLTATLTFTIQNYNALAQPEGVKASVTVNNESSNAWKTASDHKLVAEPKVNVADDKHGNYTVTITFAWGETFESKNPYAYYNSMESTAIITDNYLATGGNQQITAKEHALKYMKEVENLNTVTFKVTITATGKTTA